MSALRWLSLVALGACVHSDDPQGEPIVGEWRQVPTPVTGPIPVEQRELITFGADGSFVSNLAGEGTYEATGTRIVVALGNPPEFTRDMPIAVTSTRLLVLALRPVGPVDGVIGAWGATDTITFPSSPPQDSTYRLELRAGGTLTYDITEFGEARRMEGTWVTEGEFITVQTPERFESYTFASGALGRSPYERLP